MTKRTNPAFDMYMDSPSTSVRQWMRNHFSRMNVFSPYFDGKTSWYTQGLIYLNAYAIHTGSALAAQHPEWILRDAAGKALYIPWGCSGGTCPQYAGDFSNPDFRQWWIDAAKAALARGNYKGLWIDDVNLEWRVSDGFGNLVAPIDSHTGRAMTIDKWRLYFAQYMQAVRSALPDYEIVHNSLWFAGTGAGRDSNPSIAMQIAAADVLNIEAGVTDGGLTGGTGEWSVNAVRAYIDRVHALGKKVDIESVGASPGDLAGFEYTLANYYLVTDGQDMVGDCMGAVTPDQYWSGFDTALGTAAGARYAWKGLTRRDFSGGVVLVNDPGAPAVTVTLPGTYKTTTGASVSSITLSAKQGAVLTK